MWGWDGVCGIDGIIKPLDNQSVGLILPPLKSPYKGGEGREGLVGYFGVGKRIIIFV